MGKIMQVKRQHEEDDGKSNPTPPSEATIQTLDTEPIEVSQSTQSEHGKVPTMQNWLDRVESNVSEVPETVSNHETVSDLDTEYEQQELDYSLPSDVVILFGHLTADLPVVDSKKERPSHIFRMDELKSVSKSLAAKIVRKGKVIEIAPGFRPIYQFEYPNLGERAIGLFDHWLRTEGLPCLEHDNIWVEHFVNLWIFGATWKIPALQNAAIVVLHRYYQNPLNFRINDFSDIVKILDREEDNGKVHSILWTFARYIFVRAGGKKKFVDKPRFTNFAMQQAMHSLGFGTHGEYDVKDFMKLPAARSFHVQMLHDP